MRVMVLVKASEDSEAGILPTEGELTEMNAYNDELIKAGVVLTYDGLHASSTGARVRFDGDERTVIDGPFAETKELLAGYWLLQVKSFDEALEWVKRAPFRTGDVELRRVGEPEDFAEVAPAEMIEREQALRAELGNHEK